MLFVKLLSLVALAQAAKLPLLHPDADQAERNVARQASLTSISLTAPNTLTRTTVTSSSKSVLISSSTSLAVSGPACQSSQVSYSSELSGNLIPGTYYSTNITTTTITAVYQEGNADVYTTIDGIPRASNTLTVTSNVTWSTVSTVTSIHTLSNSVRSGFTAASPICSIDPTDCAAMYSSYRSSLGVAQTASLPSITPAPANSPRCTDSVNDYITQGYTYSAGCWNRLLSECDIIGTNVQMFYWDTTRVNGAVPHTESAGHSIPVTATHGNLTFTSPSVYLSISSVAATEYYLQNEICGDYALGGERMSAMDPLENVMVSLPPEDLTSAIHTISGVDLTTAAHDIAFGAPDYTSLLNSVLSGRNFSYESVNYTALQTPPASAYYFGLHQPPGCNLEGPHPECSTIFDGAYGAALQIPPQLRSKAPQWASCVDVLQGLYFEKPIKLTPVPASTDASNVTSTHPTSTYTSASPRSTSPSSMPSATAGPVQASGPANTSSSSSSVKVSTKTVVDPEQTSTETVYACSASKGLSSHA